MEADLRKCGEDIKRRLRQSVDRTHRSPRQQIQCGGGWRVDKSTPQKPCSPSPHRRPWYSTASCGAASRFCCVRRACSSGRHGGEACGGRFRPPSKTRSCGCSVNTLGGNDNRGHARVCGSGVGWLGEGVSDLAGKMPAAAKSIGPVGDGFLAVTPDAFASDFAADAPKPVARFMAISQVPVSAEAFDAKATVAA